MSVMRSNIRALLATSLVILSACAGVTQDEDYEGDGIGVVTSAAVAASPNLILNPSVETPTPGNATNPQYWTRASWGTNTAVFTYDTTGFSGTRSIKIDMSNFSSGDAKWIFDTIPVTAGTAYIYRDYYNATASSKVVAAYTQANGSSTFLTLGTLAATTGWATAAFSFTPPAGTTRATVYHLIAANGTLRIDDARMALPQAPEMETGVPNGALEQPSDLLPASMPLSWRTSSWGTNTPSFVYSATGRSGRSVLLTVTGYTSGDAKWYFDPVPVTPGTRYLFTDYYRANVVSFVTIRITKIDGTYVYINPGNAAVSANFVKLSIPFVAPPQAASVTVFHGLERGGSLQLDDVALAVLPPANMVNGVPNGDVEQEAYPGSDSRASWNTNVWGTNNASFSVATNGHSSGHSLRIDMTSYTSGAASWYFDAQPVNPAQAYRFSDYYKSNVDTTLVAAITLSDGSSVNMALPNAFAATDWTLYTAKLYLPSNATSIIVYHRLTSPGFLQTDDYALLPVTTEPFDRGLVSLTFDDAWLTDYNQVLPILAQHQVVATHYILTGPLGQADRLTTSMLPLLEGAGDQIAAHTVNHDDLTTLSTATASTELSAPLALFSSLGLQPVQDFASPYGAYNANVLAAIEATYDSHRTVDVGYNSKDDFDRYRLKVQNMRSTTTVTEVDAWAARAASEHTWLIIVYHDISAPPASIYGTTPSNLDAQISAIASHDLPFVTVRQAIEEIDPQLSP